MAAVTTTASTSNVPASAPPAAPDVPPNLPGGVNPLDFLYKLATQRGMTPPDFKQVTEQGPAHMKTFVWHCSFNNMVAQGTGRSKKEAKIAAAKAIRDNLDYNALPPVPNHGNAMDRKRKNRDAVNDMNGSKKRRPGGFPQQFPPGGPGFGPGFGFPYYGGYGGPMHPAAMGPGDESLKNDVKKDEEGNGEEKPDGETEEAYGGGPSREEFMDPTFGGFYDDNAAVPFDCNNDTLQPFDKERNLMVAEYQSRMARGYRSRLSKLDRHVIRKHKEIYPDERDLSSILTLVTQTEECLKKVAEALNTKEVKKITGMARVGDLSKGLLLASDKTVDLVLLCKFPPTKTLLSEVTSSVAEKLKAEYEINQVPELSGLSVSATASQLEEDCTATDKYIVRVTLTSISMTAADDDDDQGSLKVDDPLPQEQCLRALTELRHSKWFAVTAANLPSCVECIRIVKDLCKRDSAWQSLPNWAVELLVERALFSAWMPLNPAASLMRVMEVVSSGIFMKDGPGLGDPCEKQEIEVTAEMTIQQKEDLTRSAQQYLRFMHFRQIYKVLGLTKEEYFEEGVK